MSNENLFDQAVKVASGGGGFAAVLLAGRWLLNWLTGRYDKVQQRLDAERAYLDALMREHASRLEVRCEALETRSSDQQREIEACHRDKVEMERRLAALEGFDTGMGDKHEALQTVCALEKRIAALEAGRP